jgi:hypothetical protein
LDITSDDSNFIIGIHPKKYGPQLPANSMPKDVAAFLGYFGSSIIATNIPMGDETLTIEESDIEKISKNCVAIYSSPTRLMRTHNSFQVQPKVNATVHRKMTFKATKELKATSVCMQMNVPYKSPRISAATEIIQAIMQKCIFQVERRGFVKAIAHQDNGTKHPVQFLLQRLWVACVWIISTEICRSPMTPERVSSLTDTLFKDFETVFYWYGAYPQKTSWEAVKEKHGFTPAGANALTAFSASSSSAYAKVEAPAEDGDTTMELKTRKSRMWDGPTITPIDTW